MYQTTVVITPFLQFFYHYYLSLSYPSIPYSLPSFRYHYSPSVHFPYMMALFSFYSVILFCLPLPSFYLCFIRFLSYLVPSPVFLMIALELNPHLPPPKQTIFHLLFYSYSHLVFYFSLHFCLIFSLSSFLLFLFRWSINRFVAQYDKPFLTFRKNGL